MFVYSPIQLTADKCRKDFGYILYTLREHEDSPGFLGQCHRSFKESQLGFMGWTKFNESAEKSLLLDLRLSRCGISTAIVLDDLMDILMDLEFAIRTARIEVLGATKDGMAHLTRLETNVNRMVRGLVAYTQVKSVMWREREGEISMQDSWNEIDEARQSSFARHMHRSKQDGRVLHCAEMDDVLVHGEFEKEQRDKARRT